MDYLMENFSTLKALFFKTLMEKEELEEINESKINEYNDLFEEYKSELLESEVVEKEILENEIDIDLLDEKELEDFLEVCTKKMKEKEDDDDEYKEKPNSKKVEEHLQMAISLLKENKSGSAIEEFKTAILCQLAINEKYDKYQKENSKYKNEEIKCPNCGSTNIEETEDGYKCKDCGHTW